jgi:hypothetical protein
MKLRTALRLGRVSNLPTIWTNVLAGVALSGGVLPARSYPLITLGMTLFYVGGMYLNDAFDREHDARVRPERPIPSGEVSARCVFGLGYGMLAAGLACVALLPGVPSPALALVAALALGATIVFYDAHHKNNPLSPLLMGLCRVLVYVTCALCVVAALPNSVWLGATALLCYLIGLTYAAKQENLGRVDNAWPLLLLAAPFALIGGLGSAHYLAGGALALSTLYALRFIIRPSARNIPRAISHFIAGISLLDAALINSDLHPLRVAACFVAFALTLVLQRFIAGT